MSDELKRKLEEITEEVSIDEIQGALKAVVEGKPSNIAGDFLEKVNFSGKLRIHPLVRKAIDMGNITKYIRRSETYRKLNKRLVEVLERKAEIEDISYIKNLLKDLRDKAIDYIIGQAGKVEQGLRHIHAPGSVAREEGRNLYFGEQYTQKGLYKLASRLCNSIALGDNFGIYSENEGLMSDLRRIASICFKSTFKIEPKDLGINEDEANHPYATLLGFILWLVEELEVEKNEIKMLIDSILNGLKTSAISLFFMPPEKERWSTIGLPRLDIFIGRWILNRESRAKIEDLRNELKNFIMDARRRAREEGKMKEVGNAIDLLMNSYEAFCRRLIEYGDLDLYAIRKLMDIIIDLGTRYGLEIYLKPLGSVVG